MPGKARLAAAAAVVGLVTTGCTAPPAQDGAAVGTSAAEIIAAGLDAPWSIAFHEGTPLVSERDSARIVELDDDGVGREAGVIEGAANRGEGGGGTTGEGGLLGIAVQAGYLYTYLTAGGENRIERRELSGAAGSLGLGLPEIILDGIEAGSIHNGGRLAFGPDGMLYATTGDAGNRGSAQDTDSLSGKILRMMPDGGVPEDNPFPGSLVYSYGHRNPQGIAWDAEGVLYASEFGQNTWDELNVIEPGGNYGWPEMEGAAGAEGFIDPVQQWAPADASPSGIAVAGNSVYVANLRGERLLEVPLAGLDTSTVYLTREYGRLRDVVRGPDGSLWVLTNNTDGRGNPEPGDDRILRFDVAD
ncbi:PQQ-dependent sugar dehydrogenase [Arthrobacter sunyaminii]|uniref:PQQ-dependent sugar dehydrogenase n=1 Tax=Arthrobacter sunyaminii TaxID=2816859 RepID=A0A975S7V5_9MICC|nr:PQQ-dependent sugar dehydrogenase [Arthrobacter sunyaminii]MBO0906631.1 PQQ-dependent sugar dehydrogenase [Arthrobacter sunyaminii]QWQ37414.1 PQQ-dependent sugar dehydrogenase [Arthrobacter sunyaminii]